MLDRHQADSVESNTASFGEGGEERGRELKVYRRHVEGRVVIDKRRDEGVASRVLEGLQVMLNGLDEGDVVCSRRGPYEP